VSGVEAFADADIGTYTMTSAVIESGGRVVLGNVTSAFDTTVSAGGSMVTIAGAPTDTVISSGGYEEVDGGVTQDTTVLAGGVENAIGGTADFSAVAKGGLEEASINGVVSNATVSSGGVQSIGGGGSDDNSTVLAGGLLEVGVGAILNGDTISSGGALQFNGASVGALIVETSATPLTASLDGATVEAGGEVLFEDATIVAGGVLSLTSGLVTTGVDVMSGGALLGPGELQGGDIVSLDAGLVSGVSLGDVSGGHGELFIESGGAASRMTEGGAGDLITVESGAAAIDTLVVGTLALLSIESGGAASGTVVAGAGVLVFGSAALTHVSAGGADYVESGGFSHDDLVLSGGLESIVSGGTASAATVSSGGTLSLAGLAVETTVASGGTLADNGVAVWSGGATATLAGALTGGGELIEDGPGTLVLGGQSGAFDGEAIIAGGALELAAASGLGSGSVEFETARTKRTLETAAADRPPGGGTFAATLTDFDATSTFIDLAGLAFVSGARASLSGDILTLRDGGYSAAFNLAGSAANKYSVLSDGAGGTEIRAAAGSTAAPLLVHAMASFGRDRGIAAAESAHDAWIASARAEMLKPR